MSVLQKLIVKFSKNKNSDLYKRIIREIQSAEMLWIAASPATNNYYLGNENGKATAYLFSEKDYFDKFYVHKSQKDCEVQSVENPVQYRMAFFADLYRSGFEAVVIDSGQNYLRLDLFEIIKRPVHSSKNKDSRLIVNPDLMRTACWFLQEDDIKPANEDMWKLLFSEILKAEYIVPADTSKLHIDGVKSGEITLKKDSQVSFPLLQNAEGKSYYPFFTDYNELRKYDMQSNFSALASSFNDLEKFAGKSDGIVINPFGINIVLTSDMLKDIKEVSAKYEKKRSEIRVGEPKEYPLEMVNAITEFFRNTPEVSIAYLKLMVKDGKKSYLIAVGCNSDNPTAMYNKAAEVALPLADKIPIDFIDINSDFAKRVFGKSNPFYCSTN